DMLGSPKFPSSQRRGGCAIKKMSRSHHSGADGSLGEPAGSKEAAKRCTEMIRTVGPTPEKKVRPARLRSRAELTTPSATLRNGSILLMSRPPLLCEEGNIP